ncbi:MAG: hypothetical protein COB15_14915 [Flavobacteriales bacterium]|nr:MAG: hypothetical protein COB15_14915 [Flavobacteriales bacterium]
MKVDSVGSFEYLSMQREDLPTFAANLQEALKDVNQWIMITCNDLSKAQKDQKKEQLTLDSFTSVAISIQNIKGTHYGKGGKNLTVIFDKLEKEIN